NAVSYGQSGVRPGPRRSAICRSDTPYRAAAVSCSNAFEVMKRCSQCGRDYNDDSLSFCLDDGAELLFGPSGETPTAVLGSEAPTRVQNTGTASPDAGAPTVSENVKADRKLLLGIAGALLIAALGVGGYWLYGGRTSKQIDSIAVMPFVNQGGSADVEYLSDGMTETLISSLTQLPDLAVKPRSSVFRYKGKDTDAKQVANDLNVAAILNGTIVQRGSEM